MAEGHIETNEYRKRRHLWTEFFRCFWIALDPRKLLVAAAGILATSFGWWLLGAIFFGMASKPDKESPKYSKISIAKSLGVQVEEFSDENWGVEKEKRLNADQAAYAKLESLAGKNGKLSALPWNELRGENPYLTLKSVVSGTEMERRNVLSRFLPSQLPVLLEPLFKLILPVFIMTDPGATLSTKIYCFLCFIWGIAIWAFCGGVITRIAAVQLSGKDRISLSEAILFVKRRYLSYLCSPLLPIAIILAVLIVLVIYGLLGMIPFVGDVIFLGLLFPLILVLGLIMAVLLISLIGYPLMYTTISVEGSDTFDALSRAWNYVFTAPGRFFGYSAVAVLFGMAVTFLVVLVGSMTVYLGKLGVTATSSALRPSHTPDYLFINAPKTLGWRELLTHGSEIEWNNEPSLSDATKPVVKDDEKGFENYTNPSVAKKYVESYWAYHTFSTWIVSFWLFLMLLLMLGFSYSYFWSAATVLYQLMRYTVDDTELDEIHLEKNTPDQPVTPPATPANSSTTSLPMVPPASQTAVSPTVPFTPPTTPPTNSPEANKPNPSSDGPKT